MKNYYFENKDELPALEIVSDKVSPKYVPIYTSKIVDELSSNFEFKHCYFSRNGTTKHIVEMQSENARIKISNSYDRTAALRMYLTTGENGNILIPLELGKRVHVGQKAKDLTDDFKNYKNEILQAIDTTATIINTMKTTHIHDKIKEKINQSVFKSPLKRKGFKELDLDVPGFTVYDYIDNCINQYITGKYNMVITLKNGNEKIRKGREIKSNFSKLQIMNRVYKEILTNIPQLLI